MNNPLRISPKIVIATVALLALGALALVFVLGYYPQVFVDWTPIWARDIRRRESATFTAYESFLQAQGVTTTDAMVAEGKSRARAVVVNQLIEETLIKRELQKRLSKDVVSETIAGMLRRVDVETVMKNTGAIFGNDPEMLQNDVLIPQAERDILRSHLLLEDTDLDNWLVDAKKKARVILLMRRVVWEEGSAQSK